jgi:hypothetical protein
MGGNVGIGTTNPVGRLTIDGVHQPQQGSLTFFSASADFEYDGGSDGVFIFKDTGGSTAFMGGNVGIGTTSPSRLLHVEGTLFVNGQARKPGGGSWTNSSDLELKKDVNTITDALDQLLRLRGVRFFWKEPEKMGNLSGLQRGLVAQEVEKVFPEWVEEGPEGYKELTIVGFEALVVEALRELKSAIDGINQRLDTLEPQSTTTKKKKSDTAT